MSYAPRSYQTPFWQAFSPILSNWETAVIKRAALVWHRRAGKDLTALNFADLAMKTRSGVYYHILPTYAQAKKIVWDGKARDGRPFMATFLESPLYESHHETELKVTYKPTNLAPYGSTYQLIGGDSIDSVVGTNPVGCIYSEYALMNPRAWDLTRPILRENGGWAIFPFTPRGKNHAHRLWVGAQDNPRWFTSKLTVDDTLRDAPGEPGDRLVSLEDIDEDRRTGMVEELVQQEYYVSFEGAMVGAYYAGVLAAAEKEGRINDVPYDPALPVDTSWDFGIDDMTSIWFTQRVSPTRVRVIDYMQAGDNGLDWYIRELRKKPYGYGRNFAPHDVMVREYSTGNTRLQYAASQGLHFEPQPKLALEDGIDASRRLIALAVFDAVKCERGIDALRSYRRDFDEKNQTWKAQPAHDWASHGADAWRTLAVSWQATLGGGLAPSTQGRAWRGDATREPAVDTSWKRSGPQRSSGDGEPNMDIEWGDSWWGRKDG